MTLDQLHIFIAVAEREHVTRAADALGLAPPSVSAAVASLEREFGTKLFHRVGRGIVVTEGGKLLLDQARDLVNRAEALSYRDVEELLAERGLEVSYEMVRRWVLKFGPVIARR
jgi:DNA-binding transcriptional LysR family regulator